LAKLQIEDLTTLNLLLSIEGVGPGRIRNLLSKFHSLDNIISADYNSLQQVDGISDNLAKRILNGVCRFEEIKSGVIEELEKLDRLHTSLVTIWDKEYPPLLKKIYDPPLILYIKGGLIESDNFSVAVVGTRLPTNYGKLQAEKLTSELTGQNITIVSGMARGIDSVAHQAALKNNGRTIAVIGSGMDVIYPPENKKLFDEIAEKGAVISEFKPGTKPDAQNFPRRNRIISGLSLGCVVIETGINGGAMQTAALSLDQGREVFAVPGNLGMRQAEGTNMLIQKGEAKLITSAEDVLVELNLKLKPLPGENIPKHQVELNLFEEKLMNVLTGEPIQIDKISSLSGLSTADCLVHLLSLEFKGLVKQLPGKMFALL
jgi:DNA processing protein